MSTARAAALVLAVLLTLPAHALAWPTLDAEGPRTSLLGGRWTVTLGPDASTSAVVGDPRGPRPREELDGIAAVRAEDGRLVVRATVLFATAPADLEAAVRNLPAPCATPTIAAFAGHDGTVAIRCTEPSPDGAVRPLVLYATHTDGWVDRIELQLETDEATDQVAATAFAEAVAQSLRAADVSPAVERGTVVVARACAVGEAVDRLTITLPESWIATRQGEGDVTLLQIIGVRALGTPRPLASVASTPMGAPPARIPAGAGAHHPGHILGSEADWLEIVGPESAPGIREVAVALSVACGDAATWSGTVQLSAGGPSSMLDEGTRVLETLAFESERGHTVALTAVGTEEEAAPAPDEPTASAEEEAATGTSHLWSMGIGAVSLVLLAIALVMRSRTTRPK